MNWAWHQALKPVPKLVLMALADAADDEGICWPSVATLASKVGVSTRTVRRVMQELISGKLLAAEQRYRSDGSCSSNRYPYSWQGVTNCHRPLTPVTPPPDTRVRGPLTPVSYQEPPLEPKKNHHNHLCRSLNNRIVVVNDLTWNTREPSCLQSARGRRLRTRKSSCPSQHRLTKTIRLFAA